MPQASRVPAATGTTGRSSVQPSSARSTTASGSIVDDTQPSMGDAS